MDTYLVIGGEGMVGHAILELLHQRYAATTPTLRLFSSSRTRRFHDPRWEFIRSDLTSADSLRSVLDATGASTVFLSAASHFESTREMAFEVNVKGTEAVIEACLATRSITVRRLILTSSTSIVFRGEDVENVREDDIPYFDHECDYKSAYAASKAEAEKLVLAANGRNGTLYTCAIRPSGIIGFSDSTVIPQIIAILRNYQAFVQIGDNTNLCDFDHVDNVALGHILACEKLLAGSSASSSKAGAAQEMGTSPGSGPGPAAGQVFHITTGEPMPMFTFLRKVWYAYNGYTQLVTLVLPLWLVWWLAVVNEWMSGLVGRKALGITRDSLIYATAARWHNIDKARELLGYEPIVSVDEGIRRAVADYKEEERKQREKVLEAKKTR